jgi:hypothetical protein
VATLSHVEYRARVAAWAPERWIAPEWLGWFVRHVPINGTLATAAQIIVAFSALCAIVGVRARLCFGVLAVAASIVRDCAGWPRLPVLIHLLWFTRCWRQLARTCFDARRPLAARANTLPLLAVRLLLGAICLFQGCTSC